jgi:pimeloyl-ACP methyl ester carboxylesterase
MRETTSEMLAQACAADGEFRLAARYWTGGLRFERTVGAWFVSLENGNAFAGEVREDEDGVIAITAPDDVWARLLSQTPPRFYNDIANLIGSGQMVLHGDRVRYAQYYPAIMRAIELLRSRTTELSLTAAKKPGTFDSPIGRYVHLDIGGQDHRIYFEEAGSGIPMLLQHTAGCHGSQWRHLFECKAVTDRFRLIAYDLPYHGKSLPPVGPKWWATEYKLSGEFLRAVPVGLAKILELDKPVFMGCSVGGLLALDLALRHPDVFGAVVSLEGGLKIETDIDSLTALWHPQVSNEYKARLMNALMSPTSPEAYRKETSQVYASGWPPAFLGDLYYYLVDFDMRETAAKIDTSKVGVHILSGEYDASGTMEHGQAAHAAIPGSTWACMKDVGHFPMSENPEAFIRYLLPVLDRIETDRAGKT